MRVTHAYDYARTNLSATVSQAVAVQAAAIFLVTAPLALMVVAFSAATRTTDLSTWGLWSLTLAIPTALAFVMTFVAGFVGNLQHLTGRRPNAPEWDFPVAYLVQAGRSLRDARSQPGR
jgi:hypothetical protein